MGEFACRTLLITGGAGGIGVACARSLLVHMAGVFEPDPLDADDRGCPFTLFRSAASRIILANLSTYQLKNLMLNHAHEIADAGLGSNWLEFSGRMKQIARDGYYAAPGDIDPQNYGISAPIFRAPKAVIGSFRIGRTLEKMTVKDRDRLIPVVIETAERISLGIQELANGMSSRA